jgi:hypothetical protein
VSAHIEINGSHTGDDAFGVRSRQSREHATYIVHGDRLARLVDRKGAECSGGSVHCRCVFLGRALETVVDFELGNARVDDDLDGLAAGVKDENAFRIRSKDLQLAAVRRRAVTRDNDPGSDNLLFERLLLSDAASPCLTYWACWPVPNR